MIDALLYVALVLQLGDGRHAAQAARTLTHIAPKADPVIDWGRQHNAVAIRQACYDLLYDVCPVCHGEGEVHGEFVEGICKRCYGWGELRKR